MWTNLTDRKRELPCSVEPFEKPERSADIKALNSPVICCSVDAVTVCLAKRSYLYEEFPRNGLEILRYYSFLTRDTEGRSQ